jgi:hypothetical protein
LKRGDDGGRRFLEPVELEALVVEPVDGILVAPVARVLRKELLECGKCPFELREQRMDLRSFVHVRRRRRVGLAAWGNQRYELRARHVGLAAPRSARGCQRHPYGVFM